MLSSDHKRFQWAKDDRTFEPTLFRQMIQKWHPVVHFEPPEPKFTPKPRKQAPVWSPWLWIK